MLGEVERMGRPSAPLEVCGRGDQEAGDAAEPPCHQGRIREGGDAERRVEAVADDIDGGIAQMQIDGDLGIFRQEIRQQRRHLSEAKGHRCREAHQATGAGGLGERLVLRRLALGQDARRPLRQAAAGVREGETAGGAVEEAGAEAGLDPAHRLGNRGFREAQRRRRPGEGTRLHHLGEDGEAFEIGEFWHRIPGNNEFP